MFQPTLGAGGIDKKPDVIQEGGEPGSREGVSLEQLIQRMDMSEKRLLESGSDFQEKVGAETQTVGQVKNKPKLHGSLEGMKKFGAYVGGGEGYYSAEQIKAQEEIELAAAQDAVGQKTDGADQPKDEAEVKKSEILFSAIEGKIDDNFKKSSDWQGLNGQDKLMYEWINGMKLELQGMGLSQEEITKFFTNKTFGYLLTSVDLNPLQEKDQPNVLALKEAIGSFYKNPDGSFKNNAFSQEMVDNNTIGILSKVSEFSPSINRQELMKYAGYEAIDGYSPIGTVEDIDQYKKLNTNETENFELKSIFGQNRIDDSYFDFQMERIDNVPKMNSNQGELFKWLNRLVNSDLPQQGVSKESLQSVFLNKNYENLLTGTGKQLENTDLLGVFNLENELRNKNLPNVEDVISKLYLLVGNLHGSPDLADRMKKFKAGEYNDQLSH
ncbi:MAG: hypothetical protein ACOZAR_00395 [Patescibacteria group bacterium]